MEHVTSIKLAVSGVAGVFTYLFGWFGWLVLGYIACLLIDTIAGHSVAVKKGEWKSRKAREGLWHKFGSVIVVIVAAIADAVFSLIISNIPGVSMPFEYNILLCPIVIIWYTLTEMGSIIENAVALGAPVPPWLTGRLASVKNAVDAVAENGMSNLDKEGM